MPITPHPAKSLAHQLTRQPPAGDTDRFAAALVDARLELDPHQVDAALFAFQSPLSAAALLPGELRVGKTIEAGSVISRRGAASPPSGATPRSSRPAPGRRARAGSWRSASIATRRT